ncbi:MAG: hypothetical protein NTW15_20335 [Burkholderiales bacterium]|nr:hypothetical protein [Burkholderiales bacterium]
MTRSTPTTTTVSDVGGFRTPSMLPKPTDPSKTSSWYEALAKAWGQVVDDQAGAIEGLSDRISGGDDKPGTLTLLTAASAKMQFTANSASTSLGSVGNSLETMARKS